jgi:hypothetical protein
MATPATRKKSGNSWRGFLAAVVASLGVAWLGFGLYAVVVATLMALAGAMTVPDSTLVDVVALFFIVTVVTLAVVVFPAFFFLASATALWKRRAK